MADFMMEHREDGRRFALDLPWQFIQSLRLAQALMESDYAVHVPESEVPKLEYLHRYFEFAYQVGVEGVPRLESAEVVHRTREPLTRVGSIARPLIFPHAVVARCRDLWRADRPIRFAFCGLVTPERKPVLAAWVRAAGGSSLRFRGILAQLRLKRLIPGLRPRYHNRRLAITIWPSGRGREWPGKLWDEEYMSILASSRFVLCPNGKYIWSYRFFESILCGAIPVVDDVCEVYRGFDFYRLGDPAGELEWSQEKAERNFRVCVERVTVRKDVLHEELDKLFSPT